MHCDTVITVERCRRPLPAVDLALIADGLGLGWAPVSLVRTAVHRHLHRRNSRSSQPHTTTPPQLAHLPVRNRLLFLRLTSTSYI